MSLKSWFENKRIRIASNWGRAEHKAGRWMFVPTIIGLLCSWYWYNLMYLSIFACTFMFQGLYLVSHTLEKACYPSTFRFQK